ncbi:flippase [Flammeovirgaceae bacterium SG7u.111]|nr:flippase [Flammeovirgaceae bacterium SG7u.132]WPO34034.1 flippase [Flammeovirgaceae bacterium SG7u.111]
MTVMIQKLKDKLGKDADLKDMLTGSAVNFMFKILGVGFTFLLQVLVSRMYGAEGMGVFSLCVVVLQLSAMFGKAGLDQAVMKYNSQYSALGRMDIVKEINIKIFKFALGSSLLVTAILYFVSPYLAEYVFNKPHLTSYFQLTSYVVGPFTFVFIFSESLKGLRKIKSFAFLQECAHFIFATAILVIMHYFYKSDYIPEVAYMLGVMLTFIIGAILWYKQTGIMGHKASDEISYKTITDFALPIMVIYLMDALSRYIGILMLGSLATENEVGVFSAMEKITALVFLPLMVVNAIVIPKFSEFFAKNDMDKMEKSALQAGKLIMGLTAPIIIAIIILPEFILGMFGEEFKVSVYPLWVLSLGKFVFAGLGLAASVLQMTENQRIVRNVLVASTALNVALNYLLIPEFGVMGAAMSNAIAMISWNVLVLFLVKKKLGIFILYIPFISKLK